MAYSTLLRSAHPPIAYCFHMDTVALRHRLTEQTRHFALSAMLGSVAGAIITAAIAFGLPETKAWLGVLIAVILITFLALPFVALGLAIFGIPAMMLLSGNAHRWWVGVLAIVWGGGAGKLMFLGLDSLLKFNGWFLGVSEPGIAFGVPTALASWLMMRRRMPRLGYVRNGSKADIRRQ